MTLWLEMQFTEGLYDVDLRPGMRPDMACYGVSRVRALWRPQEPSLFWRAGVFAISLHPGTETVYYISIALQIMHYSTHDVAPSTKPMRISS